MSDETWIALWAGAAFLIGVGAVLATYHFGRIVVRALT